MPPDTSAIQIYTDYRVYNLSIWILSFQGSHSEKFWGLDCHPVPPNQSEKEKASASLLSSQWRHWRGHLCTGTFFTPFRALIITLL
jgi:hypothetical protein